ncbi:response regulator transcription factor [Parasporobacterium paucivorans]|uniref:Stage 0 sporulation protein A homolog n=1 Tax=Parasporobacterium paucivorans DSM 15970 TaxID=1122934 RepID=A0A1M6GX51_9FIRM|nr:response regulator transcription factor [Parasporobacterium paucivorans]SHJ14526.1 DNA-binding response regulator, OmpR family, contains REC and winged-helix (wHTH) domain [Parasporobacterium paucivorans DSM 15970]
MARVLIVDDEPMIREVIREYAELEGHEVREAESGLKAIECCRTEDFDAIIMDVMMPGIDGLTAYEKIKKTNSIPVLILSAKGEEHDKLYGFSLGIDDYVVKPFSPKELMARLGVILSRNRGRQSISDGDTSKCRLQFEGMKIDGKAYNVYIDGVKAAITMREFDLLYFLASHPNIVFSRQQLLDNVWGYDYMGDDRTVDTHVKMLRHSIGEYRKYIITARGVGYKFEVL